MPFLASLRRLAAALPAAALLAAVPAPAAAQPLALDASVACAPGATCDALRFFLALPATAPAPASIATLELTLLTPGWSFVGGPTVAFTAEDALGLTFGGAADVRDGGAPAAAGAQAYVDFLGQLSSFELFPGAGGYVQLVVTPGTDPVAFRYAGTDFSGAAFDGTVGAGGVPGVVPEPSTWTLLGAGVVALALADARRRRAAA
jgi:hypothetical protein